MPITGILPPQTDPKDPLRTFGNGATRDTSAGKLDYVKGLSPLVLERFLQYMGKHRNLPNGSKRDWDNWKKGIPTEVCLSSLVRHVVDSWKLLQGLTAEDNHGPVDLEDALCGILFNTNCILYNKLKNGRTESKDEG